MCESDLRFDVLRRAAIRCRDDRASTIVRGQSFSGFFRPFETLADSDEALRNIDRQRRVGPELVGKSLATREHLPVKFQSMLLATDFIRQVGHFISRRQ